jgi:LPXTG-site transpeptidase (sortase) family protein
MRIALVTATLAFALIALACGEPDGGPRALSADTPQPSRTATIDAPTSESARTETPEPEATPSPAEAEPTVTTAPPATSAVEPTATVPPLCRDLTFGPAETLTNEDLAERGAGTPVHKPFLGVNLVIRKIGVDAPFVARAVGPDGDMPDPETATEVVWYDFSQWQGLGGTPGTDTGNVVVAGNYDYQYVPQAVFYRLSELVAGDLIQINTSDGRTLAYEVEFNKITEVDAIDWSALVAATPEESITLITAARRNNSGRRIVWGRAWTTACTG